MENNDPDFVENYKNMAQIIVEVLNRFDGIKVHDYVTICNEITDSYLKAIIKFLARREGYNTIQNEIMSLKVRKFKINIVSINLREFQLSSKKR